MPIPEGETINCRVRKAKGCQHDRPTVESDMDPEGDGMQEDGTWDGKSVVCTACYIAIGMPANNVNPGLVAGGRGTPGRPA
jgi:hypothetical protein